MGIYIIGVAGASGSVFAESLIRFLSASGENIVHVCFSDEAVKIFRHEVVSSFVYEQTWIRDYFKSDNIVIYDQRDFFAPIASGTFKTDGMVVVPCSMKTLSGIANGYSSTLIERAAEVTLKERRRLIAVTRETPLSSIHLKNMLSLTEAGGIILPPVPAFYNKPESISDIVNFITGKITDLLNIKNDTFQRWE